MVWLVWSVWLVWFDWFDKLSGLVGETVAAFFVSLFSSIGDLVVAVNEFIFDVIVFKKSVIYI